MTIENTPSIDAATQAIVIADETAAQFVARMNTAFGNPMGNLEAIDWDRLTKQCNAIPEEIKELRDAVAAGDFDQIRDALCDVAVFSLGAMHIAGVDMSPSVAVRSHPVPSRDRALMLTMLGGTITEMERDYSMEAIPAFDRNIPAAPMGLVQALAAKDWGGVSLKLIDLTHDVYQAFDMIALDYETDMKAVLEAVMTRFCKNEEELTATVAKYRALAVKTVVAGEFPVKFLKSSKDQVGKDGALYSKGKFLKSVGFSETTFAPMPAF